MSTKQWIPLTGELVLRKLDEFSGLKFDDLKLKLGLDISAGPMSLITNLMELSSAGLVAIDGMSAEETATEVSRNFSRYMWDAPEVWRTTMQWMKTKDALSRVRLGSRRDRNAVALLCHPVFGEPGNHLDQTDIFVMMPFASEFRPVYDDHLTRVAREQQLSIRRADDFYTNSALMIDI